MEQKLRPIHLACVDDEMRYNMALIEVKNGIATATNGSLLVKVDLRIACNLTDEDLINMDGKHIHMKTWAEIHKCDELYFHETHIDCHRDGIQKTYYYTPPQGEFFRTDSVLENIREAGEEGKRIITYNGSFLQILHKIFQHESLTFSFSAGGQGTIVFPYDGSGMFGLLMPMMSDNLNRYYFR